MSRIDVVVGSTSGNAGVPGSQRFVCGRCGGFCEVSPSGQALVGEGAAVLCWNCYWTDVQPVLAAGGVVLFHTAPGAAEEIERGRRQLRRDLERLVGQFGPEHVVGDGG